MFLFNFNNGDPNRPSFFEMFAQHQMMPSFKPALKYIFAVLAQRNSKFEVIVKYHDEFFYSMLLLLEYHYLKYYEGSFSENFYNLKRSVKVSKKNEPILLQRLWDPSTAADGQAAQAPAPKKDESTVKQLRRQTLLNLMSKGSKERETKPMTARDQRISILYLVVLPYIKTKLDEFYKKESDPINSLGLLNEDNEQHPFIKQLRRLFVKIYPSISAIYEASFFIYQLLYLYEYTDFYTPFLHLQRIVLKRLTHQDIENHAAAVNTRRNERLAIVRNWPLPYVFTPIVKVLDSILDYTKFILPASVFLFKSLEWWYSENRASPPSLPVPPPPSQPKRAPNGLAIPDDKTQCPLCLKERTNPTICGSGFVYCYPCIFSYIQQHQKCPITFIPATTEHLRKIYETT